MHVRALAADDAPAFRALRLRALREPPEAFTPSDEGHEKMPPSATEQRLQQSDRRRFWGAFDSAAPLGIAGLEPEQRAKNRHKATVAGMYGASEAAGRGVGRVLIEAAMRDARATRIELLVLTVTQGNNAATALYERAGFRSFGVEPDASASAAAASPSNTWTSS